MKPLSVLSVASEIYPLVKTGGLADVAGALPAALAHEGVDVVTLVPGYPAVLSALGQATIVGDYCSLMGGPAVVRRGIASGLDLLVLDAPHLFEREGNPYLGPDGQDWPDNALRFGAFARVAADIACGRLGDIPVDVMHGHDWQAALAAAYLHYDPGTRRPGIITTIHNLAFQGIFPAYLLGALGLPADAFSVDALEYYGSISFLKAGVVFADRITTVSPTYAVEITAPEQGMGFDGLLKTRVNDLTGILNGIDMDVWDPANDPHLAAGYSGADLSARSLNKRALQKELGLQQSTTAFLVGSVGRLTGQKGMDMLAAILPDLIDRGAQLALLGSGEPQLELIFSALAQQYPGQVAIRIGYDEGLAHRIEAGVDAFVMPSRFEPCGLTQMYALRYGAVPVVARTGGLADTVIDANSYALEQGVATGFQFATASASSLAAALNSAMTLYTDDKQGWEQLQRNGMATDSSWNLAAKKYKGLYLGLMDQSFKMI
jgi:starch synthase